MVILIIILSSCGSSNNNSQSNKDSAVKASDTIKIVNDSLEYEVIIIEPGFNSWLITQPPQGFIAQSTMDISNDIKIPLYNLRVNDPIRFGTDLYPFRIDYDPQIDYGYEVTYLLFNYFIFFEQRYNQRL